MKGLLGILLFVSAALMFFRSPKDPNEGFRVENITRPLVYNSHHALPVLSAEEQDVVHNILEKPLTYLCKGGQVYIFESHDKKWVVKFMKYHLLKPSLQNRLLAWIPYVGEPIDQLVKRREKKFDALFEGYISGYNSYREQASLLYLHFNPTPHLFDKVTLIDKLGHKHVLEVDEMAFIIQKKGVPLDVALRPLLENKKIEEAATRIESVFDLYAELYQSGLYDKDYGVMHNFGFDSGKPIHLDLGKLTYDTKMRDREAAFKDLTRVKERVHNWIYKNFHDEAPWFENRLNQKINQLFHIN